MDNRFPYWFVPTQLNPAAIKLHTDIVALPAAVESSGLFAPP